MSTPTPVNVAESPEGRVPVAAPAAAFVGVLLVLVLVGVGVVGIREALLGAGVIAGPRWAANTAGAIDGLTPATWMLPAGVGAVLIGLWGVLAAFKPRRRTEVKLAGPGSVWMHRTDISRLAGAVADSVAGTTTASAKTTRRRVRLTITATAAEADTVRGQVTAAVAERLAALERTLAVKVRTRITHDGDAQ